MAKVWIGRTAKVWLLACIGTLSLLLQPECKSVPAPDKIQDVTNSIGMKLTLIPAGSFLMGSPEGENQRGIDEFQHEVEITKSFYIGVYEVTQEEYAAVMGHNPSRFSHDKPSTGLTQIDTNGFPVESVSWDSAVEFCKKLSDREQEKTAGLVYRLPTEAEWEYASRGGAKLSAPFNINAKTSFSIGLGDANFSTSYPYGDGLAGKALRRPTSVGSYKPNGFGLYDMHGNVWEWCVDSYAKDYYKISSAKDPLAREEFTRSSSYGILNDSLPVSIPWRVLRGGSFLNRGENCRSAYRYTEQSMKESLDIGFRVVCDRARDRP